LLDSGQTTDQLVHWETWRRWDSRADYADGPPLADARRGPGLLHLCQVRAGPGHAGLFDVDRGSRDGSCLSGGPGGRTGREGSQTAGATSMCLTPPLSRSAGRTGRSVAFRVVRTRCRRPRREHRSGTSVGEWAGGRARAASGGGAGCWWGPHRLRSRWSTAVPRCHRSRRQQRGAVGDGNMNEREDEQCRGEETRRQVEEQTERSGKRERRRGRGQHVVDRLRADAEARGADRDREAARKSGTTRERAGSVGWSVNSDRDRSPVGSGMNASGARFVVDDGCAASPSCPRGRGS